MGLFTCFPVLNRFFPKIFHMYQLGAMTPQKMRWSSGEMMDEQLQVAAWLKSFTCFRQAVGWLLDDLRGRIYQLEFGEVLRPGATLQVDFLVWFRFNHSTTALLSMSVIELKAVDLTLRFGGRRANNPNVESHLLDTTVGIHCLDTENRRFAYQMSSHSSQACTQESQSSTKQPKTDKRMAKEQKNNCVPFCCMPPEEIQTVTLESLVRIPGLDQQTAEDSISYLAAISACGKAQRWPESLLKFQDLMHRAIAVSPNLMNSATWTDDPQFPGLRSNFSDIQSYRGWSFGVAGLSMHGSQPINIYQWLPAWQLDILPFLGACFWNLEGLLKPSLSCFNRELIRPLHTSMPHNSLNPVHVKLLNFQDPFIVQAVSACEKGSSWNSAFGLLQVQVDTARVEIRETPERNLVIGDYWILLADHIG